MVINVVLGGDGNPAETICKNKGISRRHSSETRWIDVIERGMTGPLSALERKSIVQKKV